MSRCNCCNVILSPYELTLKNTSTNLFVDVCLKCHSFMSDDVNVVGNLELLEEVGMDIAIYDYIDYEGNKGYDEYE